MTNLGLTSTAQKAKVSLWLGSEISLWLGSEVSLGLRFVVRSGVSL